MSAAENCPETESRTRVDVSEVRRKFGRHTVTLSRWEEQGILPRSHRVNGRRCWWADEVALAEERLASLERARPQKASPERLLALAASGRAAKELNRKIREAATDALAVGGFALLKRALGPFTPTGRLDSIAPDRKADALAALRKAAAEAGLATGTTQP